ncbi:MAG: methyltransferase, partial [Actinobacteria bacterium]|nr:methyltransferase [Actinomycetota bacterium]
MKIDMFSYAENFITEDEVLVSARARGVEVGTRDVSVGTGSYLRHLAHTIAAQSVVEVGTGAGVGSI